MANNDNNGLVEIAELRERVRQLELRVKSIERGYGVSSEPGTSPQQVISRRHLDSEISAATVFTSLAMLSFVLIGALILRMLTEQHVLGARFGTLLGFAYAAHLIVLSFLPGRLGVLARSTSIFQCSGVLLGLSIALESSLRSGTFSRIQGMGFIAAFTVLAIAVALIHRKPSLAAVATTASAFSLVALGLDREGLGLQLGLLISVGACAAALSWHEGWGFLRLLVFPILLTLIAAGFWLARSASLGREPLLLSAFVFWILILLQHVFMFRRLTWLATWWLPVATAWLVCLALAESWKWLAFAAAGSSALIMAMTAATARLTPDVAPAAAGMVIAATLAGMIGWLTLDTSGLLCALAGMILWVSTGKNRSAWITGCATLLIIASAIRGLSGIVHSRASLYDLIAAGFLAGLLFFHYLRTGRPDAASQSKLPQQLAPFILVSALFLVLGLSRTVCLQMFPDPALFQLSQTAILTAAATGLTFWGHFARGRAVEYIGLSCMAVLLLKVGLIDMLQLRGILVISSVLMLGLSCVAVSFIVRRRL